MTGVPFDLTADDDGLHPPLSDDPMWTESYYFAFDLPERKMSLASYPLFRPNLGIWSLAFHLWDDRGVLPWELPYSRFLWHLPLAADADLTDFDQAGLRYKTLEPLHRYHVGYHDGDRIKMELEFEGIAKPHASWTQVDKHSQSSGKGHFDQDCRVTGLLVLDGERIPIDTFGHRDRSWYNRPDTGGRRSVSISFGINEREQFLVLYPLMVNSDAVAEDGVGGYLVRDGIRADIVSAIRTVPDRKHTYAETIEIEARDSLGRALSVRGTVASRLAFNTSPPIFCWFSQVHWSTPAGDMVGEDQETFSYEKIGPLLAEAQRSRCSASQPHP